MPHEPSEHAKAAAREISDAIESGRGFDESMVAAIIDREAITPAVAELVEALKSNESLFDEMRTAIDGYVEATERQSAVIAALLAKYA